MLKYYKRKKGKKKNQKKKKKKNQKKMKIKSLLGITIVALLVSSVLFLNSASKSDLSNNGVKVYNKEKVTQNNGNVLEKDKPPENTQEQHHETKRPPSNDIPEVKYVDVLKEEQNKNTDTPKNENFGIDFPEIKEVIVDPKTNPDTNDNDNPEIKEEENKNDDNPEIKEEKNKNDNNPEIKEEENKNDDNPEIKEEENKNTYNQKIKEEENENNVIEKALEGTPKNTGIKVSVVIPAYNSESFISKCLDSLVKQTLKEIEIIVVDNSEGSKTYDVIKEYMAADTRLRYIHNDKNIGPGPARNMGIEAAKGEYVGFVDSDDYVSQNFYEELYKTATNPESGPFDIVKGVFVMVKNGLPQSSSNGGGVVKGKGVINEVFVCQHYTAIFRRGLLVEHPDARYGDTTTGEDLVFLNAVGYYAENMTYNGGVNYYYVIREGSLYHSSNPYLFIEEYGFSKQIIDFLKKVDAKDALKRRAAKTRPFIDSVLKNNKQFENSEDPRIKGYYAAVKEFRTELDQY